MYAVVVSGGKQHKVSQGDTLVVDRLDAEVGSAIELGPVLLVGGEGSDGTRIGTPSVDGAKVTATVVSHDLGEKKETFKYRRTRSSRVSRGFRASLTTLSITEISA